MTVYTNPNSRQTGAWITRITFRQSLANVYLKVAINRGLAVMWYLLLHWGGAGCLNTGCKERSVFPQASQGAQSLRLSNSCLPHFHSTKSATGWTNCYTQRSDIIVSIIPKNIEYGKCPTTEHQLMRLSLANVCHTCEIHCNAALCRGSDLVVM